MYDAHSRFAFRSLLRTSAFLILLGVFLTLCAQAQQAPTSQSTTTVITCVSKPGERQVCKADTKAGVALVRSTGESSCLLGKNWGYDDAGVWVSDGCGGEFAVGSTREASGASKFVGLFEPYGQLRTQLAAYQDQAEVQDNATRVGINFATRSKVKVFAGTEWGVNLVQSSTQFNLSAAGPGQFGVVQTVTNPVFLARLGFVGADFGSLGRVAIGKQNAMHYDITSYTTDRFNVFGGQGTSTYVAGTDGGASGTGRADRVVNYRNNALKILEIGVQGQFGATGESNGVGTSIQLKILPGVKVGGAYTRTNWPSSAQQSVRDLGAHAEYVAAGTHVDWRVLELGVVYSHQHSGDAAFIPVPNAPNLTTAVAFGAQGAEVYSRVGLGRFGLIGGFTYLDPKVRDPLLNPDFRTRYFILGAEWFFAKNGKVYSESKLDDNSVTATGVKGYSVFTIGFRYDFSFRISHE
jgi:predicted porin